MKRILLFTFLLFSLSFFQLKAQCTIQAGPDQTICNSDSTLTVHAIRTGGSGVSWSTNGTGNFISSSNAATATYFPSTSDKILGTLLFEVQLLDSSNVCPSFRDTLIINFTSGSGPIVSAGNSQTVCASLDSIQLSPSVSNATAVSWNSSGGGTFTPSNTSANAVYHFSASDLQNGFGTLSLTATNGACSSTSIPISYTLESSFANAGSDKSVCPTASSIYIQGHATGNVLWTTSGTGTISMPMSHDSTFYYPSAADLASGQVSIKLSSTVGSCPTVIDSMIIHFTNTYSIYAGPDITACNNQHNVYVFGYASGPKIWTSTGSGSISFPTGDSIIYTPSQNDFLNGSTTLIISSTVAGCSTKSDTTTITYSAIPFADAGPNQIMTAGNVSLSGTFSNATGVTWTTSGTGTFSPNTTSTNVQYTPSANDLSNGSVYITMETTGNGACNAATDKLFLTTNDTVCNVSIVATFSGNQVEFKAINTDSTKIGSYLWDFGDGVYGSGKTQIHTYLTIGDFNASVSYNNPDSACYASGNYFVSITSLPVSVYTASGTVMAGAQALDHGFVTLFYQNGNSFIFSQYYPITPSDSGHYSFSNLQNGNYFIFAIMDTNSIHYLNYLPTYYPSEEFWTGASPLVINGSNKTGLDISLIPFTILNNTWNTGIDSIAGVITFDASVNLRIEATGPSSNPVQFAAITLYDSNGNRLSTVYTDAFGNYTFSKIAAGSYSIKIEYPGGMSVSNAIQLSVDGNPNTLTKVNTEILRQTITTSILESSSQSKSVFSTYPNPAQSELMITIPSDLSGQAELKVYSSLGISIFDQSLEAQSGSIVKLDLSAMKPGLYMIELVKGSAVYKNFFIKN